MYDGRVDGDILKSHASSFAGWGCLSWGLGEGTAGAGADGERDGEIDAEGMRVRGQERGQTDGFGSS